MSVWKKVFSWLDLQRTMEKDIVGHKLRSFRSLLKGKVKIKLQLLTLLRKSPFTSAGKWVLPQFHKRGKKKRRENLPLFPSGKVLPRGKLYWSGVRTPTITFLDFQNHASFYLGRK